MRESDNLDNLGLDGSIVLKYDGKPWSGFSSSLQRQAMGICGQCNEIVGFHKLWSFFFLVLAEELSASKEGLCSVGLVSLGAFPSPLSHTVFCLYNNNVY